MPDRYRELIATLPLPSDAQTEWFAEYVVRAHSWYKLPPIPPTATFVFYLDPQAGRSLQAKGPGSFEFRDEIERPKNAHYSWMPTAKYRAKFGYWQYANYFDKVLDERLHALRIGNVVDPEGRLLSVSPDVLVAGSVALTGVVHDLYVAGRFPLEAEMARRFLAEHGDDKDKPSLARYRWVIDTCEQYKDDLPALDRVLGVQRARERAQLRAALQRVRAVLAR